MNDATELESSLAGAIDFFQNVRRKLGALEAAADSQHTLLETVTTAVTACEQAQQTDRRTLADLADTFGTQTDRLKTLQADIRLVDEQLARLTSELESQRQTMAETGPLRQELQQHQDRLKHLDTLITKLSADTSSTRQILNVLQADLAIQNDALRELDQTWREELTSSQDRLSALERATVETKIITPTSMKEEASVATAVEESPFLTPPDSPFLVALPTDASTSSAPKSTAELLEQLRQDTQQQLAVLTANADQQTQEFRETATRTTEIQAQIEAIREQFAALSTLTDHPATESVESSLHDLQHNFDALQGTVTALDTRLAGQAQAFSSNFEQFQGLNAEIAELRQQFAKLESARRLGVLEQVLAAHGQEINQLSEALQQIKQDLPEFTEAAPDGQDAKITALEDRFNRQYAQQADLAANLEATRANSKAVQEKVLTLAANVAQRIHEFQNQLLATRTDQGAQIQTLEQKLITLQAAIEALETQRKPRRWFSMPASLTTVLVIVGAVLLAVFNRII